jgi:tripartite-type tricarboxylate transporter receptor subunit TctC
LLSLAHLKGDDMTIHRRQFLGLAASVAIIPATSRSNLAEEPYPSRPVRILVGFAAGGTFDITARLVAQWFSERLNQPFVVENRPGADGTLAAAIVAHGPADGTMLLLLGTPDAINVSLYDKLGFNLVDDIAPVGAIMRDASVMAVPPSFPAKTVPEFIAYAKAHPGKINMASAGTGSVPHAEGELFKMMTGLDMVHVPYRGGAPAVTDLLAGRVQVMFVAMSASLGYIKSGALRALAVTTAARQDKLPDVPALAKFVPGYEASGWQGLGAPKGTPDAIISRLNRALNAGLADASLRAQFAGRGATVIPGSPADFSRLIAAETEKWGKVVRAASIKMN